MRGVTNHNGDCIVNDGISIHTPHAGSDSPKLCSMRLSAGFQSTLPMRGVTLRLCSASPPSCISIHTPHAGSDIKRACRFLKQNISIHTPHAGSDSFGVAGSRSLYGFQSTLPMRGVTHQLISERGERIWKFQSTLPMRGVTKSDYIRSVKWLEFQSTLPMRGVTQPHQPGAKTL